jgi:cell division protein FtsB
MDYEMNEHNTNVAQGENSKLNDAPVSFFEQLGQFFRRNMYWFLIVGFILLLLQDVFGTHGVLAMRRSQKEAQEIRRDISRLDEENQRSQARVKALKTDPAAIEKIVREEMKRARPGEVIFDTRPRPGSDSHSDPAPSDNPVKKP